jgi:transcriptional regulator with XRE-family HTH domain
MHEPNPSRAATALLAKLKNLQMTQAELGRRRDVTAQAASAWVFGRATPGVTHMAFFEKEFGIPMRWWSEYPKRQSLPRPKRASSRRSAA